MNSRSLDEPLFYAMTLGEHGNIVLTGDEAHHLTVQRRRVGDAIALFDGRGHLARGTIQSMTRREVHVTVTERHSDPIPIPAIDLYCAVPKGDRIAVLLDMATQLAMSRFTPTRWQRSVVEPGARAEERWQRICLEACKQSRRLHAPEIAPLMTVEIAATQARARSDLLVLAHPIPHAKTLADLDYSGKQRIAIFVGPEGGVTNEEVALLRGMDARVITLGTHILRIETAAVAALSLLNTLLLPPTSAGGTPPP